MGLFDMFAKKKKILVVDDEKDIAESVKILLSEKGFKVVIANNGAEAVKKAKAERPDMIVMDLMMPEMNGFDACKMIKADTDTQNTPILVLTAQQLGKDLEDAFAAGANDYVIKPFSNERLLEKVEKLLAGKPEAAA